MAKSISCRDAGTECDFVACADTEEEALQKAADHARTDHNMSEIPKEMYEKARSIMRDVQSC